MVELVAAGVELVELVAAGVELVELVAAGVELVELVAAGVELVELVGVLGGATDGRLTVLVSGGGGVGLMSLRDTGFLRVELGPS